MSLSSGELSREYPDGRPYEEQPQWQRDFPTDIPEDDEVARREFTKFLVLTSGAFVAGQCWIAAMGQFRQHGPLPEKRIADENELASGQAIEFRYPTEDEACLLMRLADGRLVAYGQECTHLACAVVPHLHEGTLHCPCHNGHFDLVDGRPIAGPPRRPLPRIALTVKDGAIFATGVEVRTA